MQTISLQAALTLLQDGNYHQVAYVSANQDKNSGGEIVRLKSAKIIDQSQQTPINYVTDTIKSTTPKPQRHGMHATRNLSLKNGGFRKMHIFLLFRIDDYSIV